MTTILKALMLFFFWIFTEVSNRVPALAVTPETSSLFLSSVNEVRWEPEKFSHKYSRLRVFFVFTLGSLNLRVFLFLLVECSGER